MMETDLDFVDKMQQRVLADEKSPWEDWLSLFRLARRGAGTLDLLEALNDIAQWHDGPIVSGRFDEPAAASKARAAIAKIGSR